MQVSHEIAFPVSRKIPTGIFKKSKGDRGCFHLVNRVKVAPRPKRLGGFLKKVSSWIFIRTSLRGKRALEAFKAKK